MNANKIPISTAIARITSSIKWDVADDFDLATINWHDDEVAQPSLEEVQAMRQQMADEYNAIEYIKLRTEGRVELVEDTNGEKIPQKVAEGYPSLEAQLDMLYHDIKNDRLKTGNWVAAIEQVKQQFPKPE